MKPNIVSKFQLDHYYHIDGWTDRDIQWTFWLLAQEKNRVADRDHLCGLCLQNPDVMCCIKLQNYTPVMFYFHHFMWLWNSALVILYFHHCILKTFPTRGDTPPAPTPYNILFLIHEVNIKKRISQGLPWHVYCQTWVRGSIFFGE